MTKRRFSFILFVLLVISSYKLIGQGYIVSQITFSGTDKIKEAFLFKNVHHTHVGDTLSLESVEKDLLSLTSLPPIARSAYSLDTINNGVTLNFIIEDAITLIPGISFGNRGEDLWFGAGISTLNLFKTGQQVTVNYIWVDQEHNLDLYYKVPYIGASRWALAASAYRRGSLEPLFFNSGAYNYRYSIKTLSITPAFRFTPRHSLELQTSAFRETYNLEVGQENASGEVVRFKVDRKFLFDLTHRIQNIKYDYFLLHGTYNRISGQLVRTVNEEGNFYTLTDELKQFWKVGKGTNFALRVKGSIATNNNSPFAPFVLDNDANIRGVGSRTSRGTGEILTNAEVRQTLFTAGRFAGQLIGFSDIGGWRSPGGDFSDFFNKDIYKIHLGLGARLIYTRGHNYILRVDYGVDAIEGVRGTHGIVIGIGQYF